MHNRSYNIELHGLQNSQSITHQTCLMMAVKLPNNLETARANRQCWSVRPDTSEASLVYAIDQNQQRIIPAKQFEQRDAYTNSQFRGTKSWRTPSYQYPDK